MDCRWSTIVLITKGDGDYPVIGLMGVIWKFISIIINRHLAERIEFHNAIHGFREWGGNVTAMLEAKLIQYISGMHQVVL